MADRGKNKDAWCNCPGDRCEGVAPVDGCRFRWAETNLVDTHPDRHFPCDDCCKMRTKAEGGSSFGVCDGCWDKRWRRTHALLEALEMILEACTPTPNTIRSPGRGPIKKAYEAIAKARGETVAGDDAP